MIENTAPGQFTERRAAGCLVLPVVRRSAHTADEPADAQRDSHRGIRPTFDSVAQKLFQRCSLFLHRPCRVANGIFRLPIRLPGCVLSLSINILGGTGCLLDLPFYLGLHVASGASKSLLNTATHILAVPANRSSFIDMTFAPCALAPLLNTPGTVWFDARFKFAEERIARKKRYGRYLEEAHMPLSPEQGVLCDHLEKDMPSAAALIRQ